MAKGEKKFVTLPKAEFTLDLMRVKTVASPVDYGLFGGCQMWIEYVDGKIDKVPYQAAGGSDAISRAKEDYAFLTGSLRDL